jgi:hypothetical protein
MTDVVAVAVPLLCDNDVIVPPISCKERPSLDDTFIVTTFETEFWLPPDSLTVRGVAA